MVEGAGSEVGKHHGVGADLVAATAGSKAVRGGRSSKRCSMATGADTRAIGLLRGPASCAGPVRHLGLWQRGPSMAGGSRW
jgi:hypothetical protein